MPLLMRKLGGFVLIAVGILAVPIPIVPGIPIILAGIALLGDDNPLVRSGRIWLRERV